MIKHCFILIFCSFLVANLSAQYDTVLTVRLDGMGDFTSIQEAINETKSFPEKRIIIHLGKGVYREKVRVYPWNTNLTIIGKDRDSTIIAYDDFFSKMKLGRNSTFHTYTFSVEANDFRAKNLTIINSAGEVGQAIALSVAGDRCSFFNCSIVGNQDALYCTGENRRHYFRHCMIVGSTDFIFGNSVALFENCDIKSKANSFITAASTEADQPYGFVFKACTFTAAAAAVTQVFLGRPWRRYAKTVLINCEYGDHLVAEGWQVWSNVHQPTTTYYAEYVAPPGADRPDWVKELHESDLKAYSNNLILRGWIPSDA